MVFKLQGGHKVRTKNTIYNVKRVITPKVGKSKLWSLCSVYPINKHKTINMEAEVYSKDICYINHGVNISVKFRKNSNGFQARGGLDFVTDRCLWQSNMPPCPEGDIITISFGTGRLKQIV